MSTFVGRSDEGYVQASIGNDFTDGHRGMARAVAGAKKYVRSRVRAKNKIALRKEINDA